MLILFISIVLFELKSLQSFVMLPNSLLNRTQLCQINCTRNQSISDKFQRIPQCSTGQFRICEAYFGIDFDRQLVSYSFTTADARENSSSIRADLMADYRSYIETDITAIRFRQLKMKFSQMNPYRLNINYYCRTQIDDCAYQEIETIYPVYIANQHILKRIQPIFYDESISSGTKIICMNETSNDQTRLCAGYCTLTFDFHTMTKSCNETLPSDALGINISLGLAYPNHPQFTAQVSSLILVCNKPNCNSNASIEQVIAIANAFLTAQSTGIIVLPCSFLLIYPILFFVLSNF